jgi:probable O-glycosylation ligase (exosortase A-associated)
MQALFILLVWAVLVLLGFIAPFVLALAYVWVDLFRPQDVAPAIGNMLSISMITALLAVGAYLLADRRDPPRLGLLTLLLVIWAAWITLTTTWALFPTEAWRKWDWAVKTVVFTALLPLVFRTRVQIEAAILVMICAIASNVLPYAIKALLSGGGYGRRLGLVDINSGWGGEGSTLATYAFAVLPLIAFLSRHSLIAPGKGILHWAYRAAPFVFALGAFGTFARAAVVACFVWATLWWWHSRRKIAVLVVLVAGGMAVLPMMGDDWLDRVATIQEARQESSALTRIVVWQWTLDFANRNPAGGGFEAYRGNHIVLVMPDGSEIEDSARAFHSIYFEVLGEHGWVGLGIFSLILAVYFRDMLLLGRRARGRPEQAWLADLARSLIQSMLIFMAGAAFVGIAFYPLHYYLLALAVCATSAAARIPARAEADNVAAAAAAPMALRGGHPGWRSRAQGSVVQN